MSFLDLPVRASLLLALLALFACGSGGGLEDDDLLDDDDDGGDLLPPLEGSLETTNSIGRTGAYYVPERAEGSPLPTLLVFHFTGGDGAAMLPTFRDLADERGFAIVAPDSRASPDGQYTWEVGNMAGEVTPDVTHALACLDELSDELGIARDPDFVLAAGHSGGASSAPYIASNNEPFTAFAVLHGGVIQGGIGPRILPGWLSTGEDDTIRPPAELEAAADYLEGLGFDDLTLRLYPGNHGIGEQEAEELIDWWLAQ